jgi:DNA-directed RNA polymerase specialized sigma24 family protein
LNVTNLRTAMPPDQASAAAPGLFPQTDWGALRRHAQDQWTEVQEEAMAHLYRAYARPLQVFLLQRGRSELEAEEQVQGFFAFAMSRELLRNVEPRESRFRSFLLTTFTNWLIRQHRHEGAAKRGGGVVRSSLDGETLAGFEPVDDGSEDAAGGAYDREWAWAVVARAMQQVRDAYDRRGRLPVFNALRGILPGGGEVRPYAQIAADFGMSEPAVRKAAHDLRASCAEFLRAEVAATVAEPAMVDEELRYLLQLLRAAG